MARVCLLVLICAVNLGLAINWISVGEGDKPVRLWNKYRFVKRFGNSDTPVLNAWPFRIFLGGGPHKRDSGLENALSPWQAARTFMLQGKRLSAIGPNKPVLNQVIGDWMSQLSSLEKRLSLIRPNRPVVDKTAYNNLMSQLSLPGFEKRFSAIGPNKMLTTAPHDQAWIAELFGQQKRDWVHWIKRSPDRRADAKYRLWLLKTLQNSRLGKRLSLEDFGDRCFFFPVHCA